MQFCNLSEVIARAGDTFDTLKRKVTLATLFGTLQSTLVNFKYLNPEWAKNTAEERLLGVSITGIGDHEVLNSQADKKQAEEDCWPSLFRNPGDNLATWLEELRDVTIDVNARLAKILGIPASAAITCVKPSGTVSQLVDASSGIHARHSRWYLRSVRNDIKDPITRFLIDSGIPHEVDVTKPTNMVFYFPIKSPDGALTRNDLTAIEQLELWKIYQLHWCEHKPSVTVTVREHEWLKVGAWVYENFDIVSGVSFLPHSDHVYQQAPYQDLTEDEYNEWLKKMPDMLDWSLLNEYEQQDMTVGSQEYACTGNSCEVI